MHFHPNIFWSEAPFKSLIIIWCEGPFNNLFSVKGAKDAADDGQYRAPESAGSQPYNSHSKL